MGVGQPVTSPWVQSFDDYVGKVIRITVTFDSATRAITGITTFKDPGCQYTKILIGLGADGSPDTTPRAVDVPDGTTVLTQQRLNQLASRGLATIEDVLGLQITAGR